MYRCWLIAIAIALVGSAALCEPIVLATDGKPAATIVVPQGAAARLKTAAVDLQRYIADICGVSLPLNEDGKAVPGTGLYIGRCEPSLDTDLPDEGLNPETYAIRVRDGGLYLAGRYTTPTCFAVYSFIEQHLGVRWFAPGELWQFVPEGERGRLVVEVVDTVKVPDTSPRIWSGHAWTEDWNAWNIRNKTVMAEVVPRRQFQNNVYRVLPPSKYGESHPEYYPLIDGKRWIPPDDADRYWRPCESNPEVQRLVVEYARKWFDDHPTVDSFSVGMDDISHMCGCEQCRAWDPHPDSYEKRQFSDRHYKFVNAIAREIAKTHPDRYIGTLIYSIARELPKTVDKLEDNVFGFITETSAAWWMEGRKEADQALTAQWARRCKHLSRYDYYGFASIAPRYSPHHMAEQIKYDKSLGLEGMYTEVYTFLPHTAPMIWAMARLQWDHTPDIDGLIDEFCHRMYASAAPVMKRYWELLERSYNTDRPGRGAWEHRNIVNQALAMSPEDVDEGLRLLQEAESATGDPDARARIDIHRAALLYASYAIKTLALSERLIAARVADRASADEVVAATEELCRLSAERETCWAEGLQRDDLMGANLRGLADMGYLVTGSAANLERGGLVGAMKALAWYTDNAPEQLDTVCERLAADGSGSVAEIVQAWMSLMERSPENLLVNGDFESEEANRDPVEKDWTTEGAPKGWSVWSSGTGTRFEILGGKGRGNSAAASIANATSATYLQTHPAAAGEKYLCVCWVRGEPAELRCGGQLTIRLRDEKGAWHKRRDLEPQVTMVEGLEDWQPLVLLLTIPEETGSLVVMPGGRSQEEGARVLVDDIALYRIQ